MNNPRISIITPIYNVEKYIREMIESVRAQSYQDWELLLMDGASKDGTVGIINAYAARDPRIKVHSEKDEGPWHAVDKGFDAARGEYIAIVCGQDGFLDTEWLAKCMEVLEKDSEVSLVWGLSKAMSDDGVLSDDVHVSYSHFIQKESPARGAMNLVRKAGEVVRTLLFAPMERKKFILKRMFGAGAGMRFSLLANRRFEGGAPPQKQDWFYYWLKTGLLFPDQSMVVAKRVFLDCVPRYTIGNKTLGYMTDFYFNFNAKGYLSYFLPSLAIFARQHPGMSGERAGAELHDRFSEYLAKVERFREEVGQGRTRVTFIDREGKSV